MRRTLRLVGRLFGAEKTAVQAVKENDAMIVAGTLMARDLIKDQAELTDAQYEDVNQKLAKLSLDRLEDEIQNRVNKQILGMFKTIDDLLKTDFESERSFSKPPATADELQAQLKHLQKVHGFSLEVRESSIPNAGRGVFMRGTAKRGSVLALYPGYVHLREYLMEQEYAEELYPDEHYFCITRSDTSIIDGRWADHMPYNPYALGHLVNHPKDGAIPNTIQYKYNFPADPLGWSSFPTHLRRYIPNKFALRPNWYATWDQSFCMQTVVLVANETIHDGEELTMDYRLNPNFPTPTWYKPVNIHNVKLRYQKPDTSLEEALLALEAEQLAASGEAEPSEGSK